MPASFFRSKDLLKSKSKIPNSKAKAKAKAAFQPAPDRPITCDYVLNGAPLQHPSMHTTAPPWQEHQRFTAADDPDRTTVGWEPPAFTGDVDPAARSRTTTCTELKIAPAKSPKSTGDRFAMVVENVLTEGECASLIAAVNTKGFTPVLLNAGGGNQQLVRSVRDGHRVIVDSSEVTDWLLAVLAPHLPQTLAGGGEEGKALVDLNERCRFLCYTPGQYFAPHMDGSYARPRGHRDHGAVSKVTLQLYLHDVPRSHGGSTTFVRGGTGDGDDIVCQPKAGSVLLFTQNLLHEGAQLHSGLKYTMRTEAMYK